MPRIRPATAPPVKPLHFGVWRNSGNIESHATKQPVILVCRVTAYTVELVAAAKDRRLGAPMIDPERAKLQVAAVIGAVLGGVAGYVISDQLGSGGSFTILIWALIGAIVLSGLVYGLRAFRS